MPASKKKERFEIVEELRAKLIAEVEGGHWGTAAKIARETGILAPTISNLLAGNATNINARAIQALADRYNMRLMKKPKRKGAKRG